MLYNYKMVIQYEGGRYQGWQRQESTDNTIQGKLENIFSRMCGYPTQVDGSGRTDAGVHAVGQTANVRFREQYAPQEILDYANRYLPEDIRIASCIEVPERFHSRLHVVRKTYCYRVHVGRVADVFTKRYVYHLPEQLDLPKMRRAATELVGEHDFRAFTSAKKGKKSTVRRVESITIEQVGEEIRFTYIGNGFLYHMVRILTGTLIEVGQGMRTPESVAEVLASGDRALAGYLVPPQGLCLMNVEYP